MRNVFKILYLLFFSLVAFLGVWFGYLRYNGNFHVVNKEVLRSGQLYNFNFDKYYKKYHFKTILNLRGKSDKKWFKYETQFAKEHNITLINFGIDDKKIQSLKTMNKIINIIKLSKKPILIHCRAGADRTGLASALYLEYLGKDGEKMLSLKYGHFPYLGSPTKAMDESFRIWKMKKEK